MNTTDANNPLLVRYLWQNYAGLRCSKVVPFYKYNERNGDSQPKFIKDGLFYPLAYDGLPSSFDLGGQSGDLQMVPMRETLKTIPWSPKQAFVFCKFNNPDGTPYDHCPVVMMERAVASLKEEGYTVKAGIEIKFQICKDGVADIQFAENNRFVSSNSTDIFSSVIEQIYLYLLELGVNIEHINKEGPLGQFELVI